MAVSGIADRNSILLSALASRQSLPLRNEDVSAPVQVTSLGQNVVPVLAARTAEAEAALPAPETPTADAIQQNALLINEILRNLRFTSAGPTDILQSNARSSFSSTLQEAGELNPIQQNALLVNEALRNFGFTAAEPANPLLLEEIPPALEASKITEQVDLVGANAQFITETLQGLGAGAPTAAVQVATVAGEATAAATVPAAATAPAATAAATTATAAATATAATTTAAATAATVTAVAAAPATATTLTTELTPATLPLTVSPDRTPFVLAVYQLNDPAPPPETPGPIDREVPPVASVGGIKAVGDARLRQILLRLREKEQPRNIERNIGYNTPLVSIVQAEKSIRHALGRVNADIDARDLPLHLVFAKNERGFALDVYECSYPDACRVAYDVPIALDNLPGFFASLEHETGIIVDTVS